MTQRPRVTILPSPLLPPSAYSGLAESLRATGAGPTVADPSLSGDRTADTLLRRWSRDLGIARPDLLVAHSNAGYLAPVVRAQVDDQVPIVFMDAALPPEAGETRLAPPRFREHLAGLADQDGVLPPWTRWWPREVIAEVVPAELVDEIDRSCPRLPLLYFDHVLEAPDSWRRGPNTFLAFGSTYDAELDQARAWSWPTRVMDGGHLHFLHQPAAVAELVVTLARELRDAER